MTALIWMLTWLPQVLSAVSELPSPDKVTLNSSNFIHLLKWEPGPGTPRGVYYSVDAVNTNTGTSFLPVDGCQHVQHPLVCNLTETFSNRDVTYTAKVTARLEGWNSSSRTLNDFKPIRDTHLDLPLLSVTPCDEYLCVDLQCPVEHLREVYNRLDYKLRLQYNGGEKKKDIHSLERVKFKEYVLPGRKYCVSVRFSAGVRNEPSYSQPVCYLSPSLFNRDALISTLLCLLVIIGAVIVALLFSAGYICLRRRPLPRVLTSIHHLDEVLVVSPRCTSLSSLLNLKPTPPSSGKNGSKQTLSEDSDEESDEESSGRGGYKLQVGTNLVSSSSSSSSCLAAPLPRAPETTSGFSSNQTSDSPTHTSSHSEPLPECVSDPPADSLTGGSEPNKEEEGEEEEGEKEEEGQDVNLLTLTFGRHDDDEQEEEEEEDEEDELHDEISAILPAQTQDAEEEVALKSCDVDEEDEEEEEEEEEDEEDDCGYMRRPPPRVLQNLK
uniref:Interferon lambda receptor 1-like n=2 Tax=Sparus aurata TaxID=8175 RepID=A0A671XV46_SPAAU